MTIINNLCNIDIVLLRAGEAPVRFPAKAEGPTASCLAAHMRRPDSLISDVQWSRPNSTVLPPMQDNVFYIVSEEFAVVLPREDLLFPFRSWQKIERDGQGHLMTHELHTQALVPADQAPYRSLVGGFIEEVRSYLPQANLADIRDALRACKYDVERSVARLRSWGY